MHDCRCFLGSIVLLLLAVEELVIHRLRYGSLEHLLERLRIRRGIHERICLCWYAHSILTSSHSLLCLIKQLFHLIWLAKEILFECWPGLLRLRSQVGLAVVTMGDSKVDPTSYVLLLKASMWVRTAHYSMLPVWFGLAIEGLESGRWSWFTSCRALRLWTSPWNT